MMMMMIMSTNATSSARATMILDINIWHRLEDQLIFLDKWQNLGLT